MTNSLGRPTTRSPRRFNRNPFSGRPFFKPPVRGSYLLPGLSKGTRQAVQRASAARPQTSGRRDQPQAQPQAPVQTPAPQPAPVQRPQGNVVTERPDGPSAYDRTYGSFRPPPPTKGEPKTSQEIEEGRPPQMPGMSWSRLPEDRPPEDHPNVLQMPATAKAQGGRSVALPAPLNTGQRVAGPLQWTNYPRPKGDPQAPFTDEVHARTQASLRSRLTEGLRSAEGLTPEHRTRYRRSFNQVLSRLPRRALYFLEANSGGGFRFHPTTRHVGEALAQDFPNLADNQTVSRGGHGTAAAYSNKLRRLYLDGPAHLDDTDYDESHVYAHEIGHALDGPQMRHSLTGRWQKIWGEEMKDNQLSKYAASHPAEGWAEFSRLLYGNNPLPVEEVERRFPKALNYWKEHGLWIDPRETGSRSKSRP